VEGVIGHSISPNEFLCMCVCTGLHSIFRPKQLKGKSYGPITVQYSKSRRHQTLGITLLPCSTVILYLDTKLTAKIITPGLLLQNKLQLLLTVAEW
jgi:hypothetical protein